MMSLKALTRMLWRSAGREFIGIELDASYYKMAYSRVLDAELMYLLRPTL